MTASLPVPLTLGPLCLSGGEVDRGGEDRRKQDWLNAALERQQTRILPVLEGRSPLSGERLANVTVASVGGTLESATTLVWLGRADGVDWVAASFSAAPERWAEWGTPRDLREAGGELPATEAALFTQALAILHWHAVNAFCSRCGAPSVAVDAGWVRRCSAEGTEHFPRTDAAVIVLITDADDRVLLGANAAWGGSRFSMLAGFVEPGESLEEAVRREVYEEAKVSLGEPRYLGSQPWPFPASLMLAFHAVALSTDTTPDGEEILETRWFTRQELGDGVRSGAIGVPGGISVAGSMLRAWYGGELPEAPAATESKGEQR